MLLALFEQACKVGARLAWLGTRVDALLCMYLWQLILQTGIKVVATPFSIGEESKHGFYKRVQDTSKNSLLGHAH